MRIKIFEDFNENKKELINIINDAFSIIEDDDRFGPTPIEIHHDDEIPNIFVYITPPTVTGNGLDRHLNKAKSEYEILTKTKVAISLVESMCENEIDVSFEYDDNDGEDGYILLTFLEIEESGSFWVKRKGKTKLDLQKLYSFIKTPIKYITTSSSGTEQHYLDIHFKDKQSIEDYGNELIGEISEIKINGITLTQPFSESYPVRELVDFVKYVDRENTYISRDRRNNLRQNYIRFCINNELNIIW